jgi:hydrogenase maturation protease
MNRTLVDRIADAVLYEGYILYPYRPSVKNRQRWTFGGLYPEAFCRAQAGADAWSNQTECLVAGGPDPAVAATVRFLHLTARRVGEFAPPLATWPDGAEPPSRPVEVLRVGDRFFHTWQEAEERTVALGSLVPGELLDRPRRHTFTFPGRRWLEPVRGPDGAIVGVLAREQRAIDGAVEVTAARAGEGLFRVTLRVLNRTVLPDGAAGDRDDALLQALVSTHAILGVRGGEFVSLLDPPEPWREAAAACRNVGTWPVLVGAEGDRDTLLSSPIILYDYPQVAPESPGDLFDGAEIDEILTLRILTLTDAEKQAMAAVDERARALLTRTEGLGGEQLLRLHGAVRSLRPVEEGTHE